MNNFHPLPERRPVADFASMRAICDTCGSVAVRTITTETDTWAVCPPCGRLIDNRDEMGLSLRALSSFARLQQSARVDSIELLAVLRDVHLALWASV